MAIDPDDHVCEHCKFYEVAITRAGKRREIDRVPAGFCRVNPPVGVQKDTSEHLYGKWPLVVDWDWCGRFEERSGEDA